MRVQRLLSGPIIVPDMDERMGRNINGPSLIRVPEWVQHPLGRYYLYFAHHQGRYIRLAFADDIEGPWHVYSKVRCCPCCPPSAARFTNRRINFAIRVFLRRTGTSTCCIPSQAKVESRWPN